MKTRLLLLYFISLLLVGANALSSELTECLNLANYHNHRLEKDAAVRFCFDKYKATLNAESCNALIEKRVASLGSIRLTEDLRGLCFYETAGAASLPACLGQTKKFSSASAHDEAVFYCYQQFQEKMSKADCLKTAKQLIFPAKQSYLEAHCRENESSD